MAIDRMKKITIAAPVAAAQQLNQTLFNLGAVEVVDAETTRDIEGVLNRPGVSTESCDLELGRVNVALGVVNEFDPVRKGFFEGLTPLPMLMHPDELASSVRNSDLESHFLEAESIEDARKTCERREMEIKAEQEALAQVADLPFNISDLKVPRRTRVVFGSIPLKKVESLQREAASSSLLTFETLPPRTGERNSVRVVAVFLPDNEDAARRLLSTEQFEEALLPHIQGSVRDRQRELEADHAACAEEFARIRERALALAKHRRALLLLKAHWEGIRRLHLSRGAAVEGRFVHVLVGYCRTRDLERVERALCSEVPEASIFADDPGPDDDVPVSITLPRMIRPIYMLVSMFGLPAYSAFDPSPYIIFPFYLFFGICFGDVGYGLMLIAVGFYLSRKTKNFEGVYNFSQLLYFAGFSTVLFGALLGSWFGDLPDPRYLGEGNPLLVAKDKLMVLDPLKDPITMLLIALGIGMCVQLYGVVLKMHGAAQSGDWPTVAFDGLLWLITLPGVILLIGNFLGALGPAFGYVGKIMFITGAVGLILTQGRNEKGILLKLVTGIVSIYGILGSYGVAAFIGDTLSYCRLLALGLTTGIVAMCVNTIAGLLREVSVVGPVLFVLVLVFGHLFNFVISLLGAFVHSMRLIFVELFGRFYSGGAREFRPLGFDSDSFQLAPDAQRANPLPTDR